MLTINIDMDKQCKGCGHKGATESGYCLKCVTKFITNKKVGETMESKIGPKTIQKMKSEASDKIDIYAAQIDKAFMKSEDGKLKISIGYDISMSEKTANGIDVSTTIGFVADKIKDKTTCTVVESQTELPLPDKVYKLKGD